MPFSLYQRTGYLALVGQSLKPVNVATSRSQRLSALRYKRYYFSLLYSVLTAETAKYVKVDMADIVTG